MSYHRLNNNDHRVTVDEELWETLETLSNQGMDIGQRATRNLTKTRKSKKQGVRTPRKLEDYN